VADAREVPAKRTNRHVWAIVAVHANAAEKPRFDLGDNHPIRPTVQYLQLVCQSGRRDKRSPAATPFYAGGVECLEILKGRNRGNAVPPIQVDALAKHWVLEYADLWTTVGGNQVLVVFDELRWDPAARRKRHGG